MSKLGLIDLISVVPDLNLSELRALEASVQTAIRIRSQSNLSTDSSFGADTSSEVTPDEGPSLNDWAQVILEEMDTYELSLADQGLLASLILSDVYQQETFSSRDIHNVIKECGRPQIANITSALSGIKDRAFLVENSDKELSLSPEGRKKARALIGQARRAKKAA